MAGSASAWNPQMDVFSKDYRCFAWDMPGFGDSGDPVEGMDMGQVVDQLSRFVVKQLRLRAAHFVGLSVGGMILQHFAVRHPELTRSVTILDSSPKFGFGGDMKSAEFADPILAELESGTKPAVFSDGMVRAIVGPDCSEDTKREAIAAMSRSRSSGLALTTRLIADHDALNILSQITCPTLVMAGEKDEETPPAYAYEIAQRISGASVTIIPNAGHIVNLENPKAVNTRLRFFLENGL
jgi:3-oxoadipate enol-lactonase